MGKNLKRVGYVEIALIGLRQAKLEVMLEGLQAS
jgi:hypothetical protein